MKLINQEKLWKKEEGFIKSYPCWSYPTPISTNRSFMLDPTGTDVLVTPAPGLPSMIDDDGTALIGDPSLKDW